MTRTVDQGQDARHATSRANLYGAAMVNRGGDRVLQIHGGMGHTKELPVERWYRPVRPRVTTSFFRSVLVGEQGEIVIRGQQGHPAAVPLLASKSIRPRWKGCCRGIRRSPRWR